MIQNGKAYVDELSPEELREYRGTLATPGKDSPYRDRSIRENMELFENMRDGKYPDGKFILRAKIDMKSPNLNLRDPTLYRIKHASHPITGNKWCIYPMYDFAHSLSDAIEGITHSICTLEFADHRPLYDWIIDNTLPSGLLEACSDGRRPTQIEFSRLNLQYTVLSKRKLIQLVKDDIVDGWNDPRMPTISGIRRRGIPSLALKLFCDRIGKEKARKCALILHTAPKDQNGTDLTKVKEALCDPDYVNVYFSKQKLTTEQMNWMYNLADLTVLPSSNEGWGLALTESMMAETMIAANVTGGMQDQMRFTDEKGKWIDFDADFPSNHRGTYKDCGDWAIPIFPSNISVVGSIPTPYIFDDRCNFEDIASAIEECYKLTPEERQQRGRAAREWVTSKESGMSAVSMCNNVISSIEETLKIFTPRSDFDFIKVEDQKRDYVEHKLIY